jgi:hypothetical protein
MTGKELYALYQRKFAERGCQVDDWDDLEQMDRDVWCALAIELLGAV